MMRQRTEVVEKLGVDRPAMVFIPDAFAEQFRSEFFHGFGQRNAFAVFGNEVADAFVLSGQRAVVGGRGTSQPALVDAAARAAQRVVIVRMQFDAPTRNAERARNPVRSQTEDASVLLKGLSDFCGICHLQSPSRFLKLIFSCVSTVSYGFIRRAFPDFMSAFRPSRETFAGSIPSA